MSKFKNILKSPFFIVPVVSLLVSGALISAFVITDKDNKVEYKTEQTSSSTSTLYKGHLRGFFSNSLSCILHC